MDVIGPAPPTRPPEQPVFYYDLGDPWCYLVAERIMAELGALGPVPEWEPVHGRRIGVAAADVDVARLAAVLHAHGLQPLRMPRHGSGESELAMLAATFAKRSGRAVAFSLAAFRQAFAAGRDLGDESTVLIAAAACELHPTAVLKGISLRSVTGALDAACERARAAGVRALPAIELGGRVFAGPDALEQATGALTAAGST